ncbi:MAG: protein kinase [Vicinamibacteria bacterium]
MTRAISEVCSACGAAMEGSASSCFHCGHTHRLSPLKKGQIIAGRYELTGVLGHGGMGTVYEVHDRALDERLALKVLSETAQASADADRRFRAEIKLARKIRHPNVCAIHEYGELKDMQYIVMEFVEGQDLKKYLRSRGELGADEAIDLACQVGEGLQAIHDAGVIHRDLKSANIMRDPSGRPRLMDFGIAKSFGDTAATATGQIIGTPEYMSPEQARGEQLDQRSDVYSLAIVTYELLTGRVPFKSDTPFGTIMLQVHEPPALDQPSIPLVLAPILKKGLEKRPQDRYESASAFVSALRLVRDGLPQGRPRLALINDLEVEETASTTLPSVTGEAREPEWLAPALVELATIERAAPSEAVVDSAAEATIGADTPAVSRPRHRRAWIVSSLGILAFALIALVTQVRPRDRSNSEKAPEPETWNNQLVYPEANVEKSPLLLIHEIPKPKIEPGRVVSMTLSWIVTPEGVVDNPKIVVSAYPEIDAFVVEGIRKWRYQPGQMAGKAVPVRLLRKYTFSDATPIGPQAPTFSVRAGSTVKGCLARGPCNLAPTVSIQLIEEAPEVEIVTEMVTAGGQVCLTSRSGKLGRVANSVRTLPNFSSRCKPPFSTTTIFVEVLSGSTPILRQSYPASFSFN